MVIESFSGKVEWDEELGAFLLSLSGDDRHRLHCGALIAGVLHGKYIKVTIEEIDPEIN